MMPEFHNTQEAWDFGEKIEGNRDIIDRLKSFRDLLIQKIEKLKENKDPDFDQWSILATQSQLIRECLEKAEGENKDKGSETGDKKEAQSILNIRLMNKWKENRKNKIYKGDILQVEDDRSSVCNRGERLIVIGIEPDPYTSNAFIDDWILVKRITDGSSDRNRRWWVLESTDLVSEDQGPNINIPEWKEEEENKKQGQRTIEINDQESLDQLTRIESDQSIKITGNLKLNHYLEVYGRLEVHNLDYSGYWIYAYGNSIIHAYDNSLVYAYGNSDIHAFGNSIVYAHDNSKVSANGNSKVYAYDNSQVYAHDNSQVYANDNSQVYLLNNAKIIEDHRVNKHYKETELDINIPEWKEEENKREGQANPKYKKGDIIKTKRIIKTRAGEIVLERTEGEIIKVDPNDYLYSDVPERGSYEIKWANHFYATKWTTPFIDERTVLASNNMDISIPEWKEEEENKKQGQRTIEINDQESLDQLTRIESDQSIKITGTGNLKLNHRLEVYGRLEVHNLDCFDYWIYAYGNSIVFAYDNSIVSAYDNSKVYAYDNSQVYANGNSIVNAYDNSKVYAYGNSVVSANGNSQVNASDSSKVNAYDSSKVNAYNNSKVDLFNNAKIIEDYRVKPEPELDIQIPEWKEEEENKKEGSVIRKEEQVDCNKKILVADNSNKDIGSQIRDIGYEISDAVYKRADIGFQIPDIRDKIPETGVQEPETGGNIPPPAFQNSLQASKYGSTNKGYDPKIKGLAQASENLGKKIEIFSGTPSPDFETWMRVSLQQSYVREALESADRGDLVYVSKTEGSEKEVRAQRKFKVGDRVKILKRPDAGWFGRKNTGTVETVSSEGDFYPYKIKIDFLRPDEHSLAWFREDKLELLVTGEMDIQIP
ncbi:Uncharacterised protein [uncultured archaeon]|nr:Uncharacterised protein [uncultured archaeon]